MLEKCVMLGAATAALVVASGTAASAQASRPASADRAGHARDRAVEIVLIDNLRRDGGVFVVMIDDLT